jgi:isoquinoline 1-oxidoreductase beta subunit
MTAFAPTRRAFLQVAATAAGGALFSVALPAGAQNATGSGRPAEAAALTAFLRIEPDGGIVVLNPFVEMGQGTYTAIPQILAEELDAPMSAMRVEQAPHGDAWKVLDFGAPIRFTGGSYSVRGSYDTMRRAGAAARALLVAAAAERLGVPAAELRTADAAVRHDATGRSLTYGELAADTVGRTAPEGVVPKDPATFRLIGTDVPRTDSLAKATGTALFGVDVRVEGMLYAAIAHPPTIGGRATAFDAASIERMPGSPKAYEVNGAVAVVADSWWRAKRALEALEIDWDAGPNLGLWSDALAQALTARLDETGIEAEAEGDAPAALAAATNRVQADYLQPFLAHATMEPQTCTADARADGCDVWGPNQGADFVAMTAAAVTGLPLDAIRVHTTFLGGGFGRRFDLDFVAQAVTLSKLSGRPVKLVWSREEDLRNDPYRPMAAVRMRAALGPDGLPAALHVTTVTEGPAARMFPGLVRADGLDPTAVEGLVKQPYRVGARRTDFVPGDFPMVRVGFWRSVGGALNAFPYESFLDELAHAVGRDPLEYRLALLAPGSNERALVEKVRDMAGWRPGVYEVDGRRRAMGVALHESFGSLVAEIAEVSVRAGRPRVHRVWAAIDLGRAVNPAIVKAQIVGGVNYGLSAALHEEVTIEEGRVVKGNFDAYPLLAPDEAPDVTVEIVTSDRPMGGVGEPGTPPVAPAVCNALFALTGERVRRLPLSRHAFRDA